MKFDFNEVKNFEEHIELSIPNYLTLDKIFREISHEYAQPESILVDLGCSTGRFISSLEKIEGVDYIGVDEVDMTDRRKDFSFIRGDAENIFKLKGSNKNVSVIISMFFLQFLGSSKRNRMLQIIKEQIDKGAVFLVAEKVFLKDSRLQQTLHRLHIQEKRKGFKDKDILDKDKQLSISMYCKYESELEKELHCLGEVSKVWQSFNFMGYVVKKGHSA